MKVGSTLTIQGWNMLIWNGHSPRSHALARHCNHDPRRRWCSSFISTAEEWFWLTLWETQLSTQRSTSLLWEECAKLCDARDQICGPRNPSSYCRTTQSLTRPSTPLHSSRRSTKNFGPIHLTPRTWVHAIFFCISTPQSAHQRPSFPKSGWRGTSSEMRAVFLASWEIQQLFLKVAGALPSLHCSRRTLLWRTRQTWISCTWRSANLSDTLREMQGNPCRNLVLTDGRQLLLLRIFATDAHRQLVHWSLK